MIVDTATLATLRAAMLPMDGTIADHAEEILAAAAEAMSPARARELAYVDLTAGSCLLPLAFAAAGARSVVVNDIATRSIVAARALFAGGDVPAGMLDDALAGRLPARAHVPSFRFASDYLPEAACRTFDRLYHLDLPAPQAATLRYLALRHVLRLADPEEGFRVLLTHDRAQLLADREEDWSRFVVRLDEGTDGIAADLLAVRAGARAAAAAGSTRVLQADMRDIAAAIDFTGPCLVAVNPPTNGVDEYVIDDQIVHSLVANRLVPLSRCTEDPAEFWTRRVEAALAPMPTGTLFLVWGGDGAMTAAACEAAWRRHGDVVHRATISFGDGRGATWGIFRRR